MAGKESRIHVPDAIGWLEGASSDLLTAIWERSDRVAFPSGHAYTRAGDSAGGLTAIVSGRVDLHLPGVREGRTLVQVFGPGWWLGDLSAISGEERAFDHFTALPSELLRLSKTELDRICQDYPDTWRRLAYMATANMGIAVSAAAQYRLPNPPARIASCLLRIHRTGPDWDGRLPISQADLASVADISRRSTIAALEALEGSGAIKREYRAVQILDSGLLMDAASINAC